MSKYIVVKEREKIKTPEFDENKKREKLQTEGVKNTKEKEPIEVLSIESQKKKNIIPSQTIKTTKSTLSFSPLVIEEEKTIRKIPSIIPSDKKNSPNLVTYKEEIQKSKIALSSKLSEKKGNFALETVTTIEKKSSPSFIPLKIEEKSKESEKLNAPAVVVSKVRGNDLTQNQQMFSKEKEFLFVEPSGSKEDKELYNEYELLQKEGERLDIPSTENKETKKVEDLPTAPLKKDKDLVGAFNQIDKEDEELEGVILQAKEMLGITGDISEEDKRKLSLLIPEIENLSTNGKINPSKKIKEKSKGFWDKTKDLLEELLGFNLEVATLKSLLMPPELDKLLSDIKSFKGAVASGNIVDIINGSFNLSNELYDKMSHFTFGEIAGLYATNFFTITGFKPSPSIKNPGESQFGNDTWKGGVLINPDDPFGSIENIGNLIFRKAGRFTDLTGLKNFSIGQIGNFVFRGNGLKGISVDKERWKQVWGLDIGNIDANSIKANNTEEEPSATDIVMGSLEYDEAGDGWSFDPSKLFDPAIRLGGLTKSEWLNEKIKNSGWDLRDISNININAIFEALDIGNKKANQVKEKAAVQIVDPSIQEALTAIGLSEGKLKEEGAKNLNLLKNLMTNRKITGVTKNKFNSIIEALKKFYGNNYKEDKSPVTNVGYDIASVETAEDIPHINLVGPFDYDEDNLSKLRKNIEENYNSTKIRNNYSLGYMIVEPATFNKNFENFKIDFQFNPEITEGSLEARYDSATILNRIGQIETYVGTDSIKATMKLQYRVLSRDNTKGNSWMSKWTLDYIQQIEMALRALTVPANIGNRTTRPPVIRIEMGDASNLFKFPILMNKSQRWRYFIATSVTINKMYDGNSYYIAGASYDQNGNVMAPYSYPYARDMMGFDADINLTEVKKSYFTYYPNFNDYYESVTQNSNTNNLPYFILPPGVN